MSPKIAVVHEWLVDHSGSEKVLEQILQVFPEADLFSVVEFLPKTLRHFIQHKPVKTTFIQKLPFARKHYRNYLPLMPLAIEQLDVSGYDVVISNSHAVAKGIITSHRQLHVCYCHSPIRYAWDLYHQYLRESKLDQGIKGWVAKLFLHYMRLWDLSTIHRIDAFVANSHYIAQRIGKVYRREASVIYPPVDVENFEIFLHKEEFFLTASRLVPYKKIDLIVEAFTQLPDKKLIVIGDGPDYKKISAIARGHDNIVMMGFQPFDVLKGHMQRARAFVFAADEDFGIIPVEAQACGTPVIAYQQGGALETIIAEKTGLFFPAQDVDALTRTVHQFEQKAHQFDPQQIRQHAENFSINRFRKDFKYLIENKLEEKLEVFSSTL